MSFKQLILMSAALLAGRMSSAQESRFFINQSEGKSDIQMTYKRTDTSFETGSALVNLIDAKYTRALEDMTQFEIGVGFAQKDVRINKISTGETVALRKTGVSFTDIDLSLKTAWEQEKFTWYVGGVASISPGAARSPRYLNYIPNSSTEIEVNELSGYQTLGGVIGIQSYADKLALGAEFEARAYSARNIDNTKRGVTTENEGGKVIPQLSGFIEFPLARKVNLGFNAALTRPDFQLDRVLFGGPENRFQGQLYSEWTVDAETSATFEVGYSALNVPDLEERSNFNVGVKKAL